MAFRKRNRALSLAVLALGFCGVVPGRAAVTPGGDTTLGPFGTTTGTTTVGITGIGTLTIDEGSSFTDLNGYLGSQAGSNGAATVTGTGSEWINLRSLFVGLFGSGTLTVDKNALVTASTLYASPDALYGNGTISVHGVVIDAGVVFDSTHGTTQVVSFGSGGSLNLVINGTGSMGAGYKSSGSLRIANGKAVGSLDGYLGYHTGSSGSATVNGAGSRWTNSGSLHVGSAGSGTLSLEAGGQVSNTYGYLGEQNGATGTVTVRGAGSRWTNTQDLYVGGEGHGTLTVAEGAAVSAATLYASLDDLSGDGTITTSTGAVLDGDLVFDNSHGNKATLNFGAGGTLNVTINGGALGVGYKRAGSLRISNGMALTTFSGHVGYRAGSTGVATVSGAGSTWTNSGQLFVGRSGNGSLIIEDGAKVSSNTCSLGDSAGSAGAVTVKGAGSRWTNIGMTGHTLFHIGSAGSGSLNVEAGGQVSSTYGHLGYDAGSQGTVTLTGANSSWSIQDVLSVGHAGSGTLSLESGAQASNLDGYLGYSTGSSGAATVRGTGSNWANSRHLYVGNSSTGTLTIADGGQVSNVNGHVGFGAVACGTVTVSGAGSQWTNSDALYVANSGIGSLTIEGGGQVGSASGYLGYNAGSSGTATVRGAASVWSSGSSLIVGSAGNGRLTIEAGGKVQSSTACLSTTLGSTGAATVTGAGSMWVTDGILYVTNAGAGSLTVSDGGLVIARTLYAASTDLHGNGTINATNGALLDAHLVFDAGHGNVNTVSFGSGGVLNLTVDGGDLGVGCKGNGSLRITDGVALATAAGYLGHQTGSTGVATVSGEGSKWVGSSKLYIGNDGSGTLTIEGGGQVSDTSGYLGSQPGSSGTVTVRGAGSAWTNSSNLRVGSSGSAALAISGGGQVSSSGASLVAENGGSSGTVTVSGAGSCWSNDGELRVGWYGNGSLDIHEGGQIRSTRMILGGYAGSSGTATVRGAGSRLVTNSLAVGSSGTGTLIIADGAELSFNYGGTDSSIGNSAGSIGMVKVSGIGSKWISGANLSIGNEGSATLIIEAGGEVSNRDANLGFYATSTGAPTVVTVTGAGSAWISSGTVDATRGAHTTLTVADGGKVMARRVKLGTQSLSHK